MPRLLIVLLVLLAGAFPARAQAPAHVIPFELYDNRIYLDVGGPGFAHRSFLLDTGAQLTHYTAELVAEAGLRTSGRVGITGTGAGRVRGAYVAPAALRIGTLTLPVGRGISAPAELLFGPVFSGTGRRFEGVVGYDLFAAYAVEIDYAARLLRLYPRRGAPAAGDPVPIRLIDRKPYVEASLTFGGATVPALLHLDTGFGGTLSLNGRFVAQQNLLARVGPTLAAVMRGVGGAAEARLARIDRLVFGPVVAERPIVSLSLIQGAGVRAESAGRIGGELLRRYRVTIDYAARTVRFVPGAGVEAPFEADMSGLALLQAAEGLVVAGVAEGTAAAEAGVRAGDRLLALDGRPAAAMTLEAVRAALREDGAGRRLLLLRDGREVEALLRLRRRI
ncbi:MAG TPA: PDZ domain-containing protein [Allosphingosinicella sp.]